jgi:ADP-ribose pyrophosphatase
MSNLEEKTISAETIFEGRLLKLKKVSVKLASGVKSTREIVEHPGAVAVIAITSENELVLVRQFRKAVDTILLEVPAGVPEKGETGEAAAQRELEEETGFHAKKIKKLWEGYSSPGYSNELIQYYLAQDMVTVPRRPEEDEQIEVDLVDIDACVDMVKNGKIKDNKTMIGVLLAEMVMNGQI